MNNLKMLLEEILPYYFLIMVFVIMFTDHMPTDFELYILFAFAFGVSLYNNRLYKTLEGLTKWGNEALETVKKLELERVKMKRHVATLEEEINNMRELTSNESNRIDIGNLSSSTVLKEFQKHMEKQKESPRRF